MIQNKKNVGIEVRKIRLYEVKRGIKQDMILCKS